MLRRLRRDRCQGRTIDGLGWRVGQLIERLVWRLGRIDDRAVAAIDIKSGDGFFEDDTLIVPFAVPLGFDAVVTDGPAFIALYATFATCFGVKSDV